MLSLSAAELDTLGLECGLASADILKLQRLVTEERGAWGCIMS